MYVTYQTKLAMMAQVAVAALIRVPMGPLLVIAVDARREKFVMCLTVNVLAAKVVGQRLAREMELAVGLIGNVVLEIAPQIAISVLGQSQPRSRFLLGRHLAVRPVVVQFREQAKLAVIVVPGNSVLKTIQDAPVEKVVALPVAVQMTVIVVVVSAKGEPVAVRVRWSVGLMKLA